MKKERLKKGERERKYRKTAKDPEAGMKERGCEYTRTHTLTTHTHTQAVRDGGEDKRVEIGCLSSSRGLSLVFLHLRSNKQAIHDATASPCHIVTKPQPERATAAAAAVDGLPLPQLLLLLPLLLQAKRSARVSVARTISLVSFFAPGSLSARLWLWLLVSGSNLRDPLAR